MKFGLRHIRYFVAVAEELHFRRAADRLGIAQPALSRAIRNLEQDLGVALFERTNRRVQITATGKVFLEECRGVARAFDTMIERTRRAQAGRVGSLRIGYTDNAIAGVLPGVLKSFLDRQPEIVLQPLHDTTVTQLAKLDSGELDVGFVTGPIHRPEYRQIPVQSERFVCVVYADHPLARRRSIRLGELAHEDFVHGSAEEWQHFHAYLLPMCRRAGFVPRIVQEAFNTAGILGLVASGMGLTIVGECSTLALNPGLVAIGIEDAGERLQTAMAWKPDRLSGPKQLFVEHVRRMTGTPSG